MSPILVRAGVLAIAALALSSPSAAGEKRVVAIGDIHGSLDGLTEILRETGLIDAEARWRGGKAILVQTGDFTDRGGRVRDVMDLLIELQTEARAAGGEVVVLLGNHEMLNLMRHDADVVVNPKIYASFADQRSESTRRKALVDWREWRRRRAATAGLESLPDESDEEWLARHPPGFVEYHQAMSARGRYGKWLRQRPIVLRIDDTIFLHGGLSETFAELTLARINELHRSEIETLDLTLSQLERKRIIPPHATWSEITLEIDRRLKNPEMKKNRATIEQARKHLDRFVAITGSADSPLWFRGYSEPPHGLEDNALAALRTRLIEAYGASHFVAAHTPLKSEDIAMRLDGAFFLIDTGMLEPVYHGRASALEIEWDGFTAVYRGDRKTLVASSRSIERRTRATPDAGGNGSNRGGGSGGNGFAALRRTPRSGLRIALASARFEDEVQQEDVAPAERPPRRWLDQTDELLPFEGPEQVEDFLRRARVLSKTPVGVGKTGALQLELELDGARARGIYHAINDHRSPASAGGAIRLSRGTTMLRFRDSYTGQVAAYHLARMMGLDHVPPAVVREVDGVKGSVALWIEGGTNLTTWRKSRPRQPQNDFYQQQLFDMRVFDALVNNKDRNTGNIFWTPDWNLWLIDHTRTFASDNVLYRPELVQRCSRDLLARIQQLDEATAIEELKPYLSIFEIKAIFKRRKRLLRYLDDRILKLGEERVLFDYGQPMGLVTIRSVDGAAA